MEKGGDSRTGFSVLDKSSSSSNTSINPTQLMFHHHHQQQGSCYNLGRPFAAADDDAGIVGPTGGASEVLPDIYPHDLSSSVAGGGIFAPNLHSAYSTIPCKSQGGGMGFPFTASQWKELERQAMIYKCMISSVPVPPYLLLPLSTNFSPTSLHSSLSCIFTFSFTTLSPFLSLSHQLQLIGGGFVNKAAYSGGRYSKNGDPEPGRCKRTDGKKWRCAKEVAPQQKYCERHLHRGRPRSRKPVEPKTINNGGDDDTHKKTRLQLSKSHHPLLCLNPKTHLTISTPYYKPSTRDLEMEQPWENMMEPNMGLGNCYFPQDYMDEAFSCPNFPTPEIDLPTRFIDAWSIDNLNTRNSIADIKPSMNEGDLSPSLNLSMAMAAGSIVDSVKDGDDDKSKDHPMWPSPAPWEPFAGGGPLGEALQPGSMAVGGSNPASPYNSISTPATSPSGVLHWTLFSHSDSSVCNSPTLVAPPSSEAASNQWQN